MPGESKILSESCEETTTQTLLIFIDSLQKILLALPLSEKIAIFQIFSGQDTKNNDWTLVSFF
jgi:hypothetical protein